VVVIAAALIGVALIGVALIGVALIGVALIGVALIGVAVFNGSDVISSGVGSVVGAMVWLLCGTEMPMTALAVKWVLFVAA
jgi:hypothetical protein